MVYTNCLYKLDISVSTAMIFMQPSSLFLLPNYHKLPYLLLSSKCILLQIFFSDFSLNTHYCPMHSTRIVNN